VYVHENHVWTKLGGTVDNFTKAAGFRWQSAVMEA